MFKPSTFRKFLPVASIVALALLVVLGVAAGLRRHSGSAVTQRAAAPSTQTPSTEQNARVRASMQALPLAFEANQGQTDPQVKYMARGNGYTVFLTSNDTVFALRSSSGCRPSTAGPARHQAATGTLPPATKDRTASIRMHLVGGNPQAQITAGSELPWRSNYFIGADRSQWHTNVAQFARVSYRDAYPGVDLAFYGAQKQLEFDFIVAPGASPAPIRFDISGAIRIVTQPDGNLLLASSAGDVSLHKPVAYQQKDGVREPVDARFVLQAKNQVSFELGDYDHSRELVIDPSVGYATYLGGSLEDDGYGIAIDGSGNAYVTGQTKSNPFPGTTGGYKGGFDVFVSKLSPTGTLVYSTYVGGSLDDAGNAIAVDGSGDVFVAGGTSSTDFPTMNAYQNSLGGGVGLDAFVFELNNAGSTLKYSTYLGGSGADVANGLAIDGLGNAYVVGSTASANFPVKNPIAPGTVLTGTSNGFVTKLTALGNSLDYSTFLGGDGDFATAVALNSSDSGYATGLTPAYVTGATQTATFPTTAGAFKTSCGTAANCNGGLDDAFVSVINAAGSGFVYSTFLGGSAKDQGLAIAVDSSGDAYVTGLTQSTDFPKQNAIFSTLGGVQDAFVTALNPTGSALLYSTYLGGSSGDAGSGIAVDANQNAYVTGLTASSDFPVGHATQPALGGATDGFVTQLRPSGTLVFSTFLGGSGNEDSTTSGSSLSPVGAIAVDSAGANLYVTGNTASSNFLPAGVTGSAQNTFGGGTFDAFVVKYTTGAGNNNFSIADGALSATSGNPGVSATSTITVTSTNGFSSAVALTCAVTPVVSHGPTCSFNPSSVTPPANSTVTSTLTVSTTATSALLERPSNGPSSGIFYAMFLPMGGMVLLGGLGSSGTRRKKLFGFLMLGAVLTGLLLMPACGGSSGSKSSGTPAGAYTITVTGTSGASTATGTPALTLTVN